MLGWIPPEEYINPPETAEWRELKARWLKRNPPPPMNSPQFKAWLKRSKKLQAWAEKKGIQTTPYARAYPMVVKPPTVGQPPSRLPRIPSPYEKPVEHKLKPIKPRPDDIIYKQPILPSPIETPVDRKVKKLPKGQKKKWMPRLSETQRLISGSYVPPPPQPTGHQPPSAKEVKKVVKRVAKIATRLPRIRR